MMTPISLVVYASVGLAAFKLVVTLFQGLRNPLASVPGPWYTNFTSNVLWYHWLRGSRSHYVERLHQRYGTVVRVAPSEVDFSSVSGAKRIHSYRDAFRKSAFYDSFVGPNKAPSVFNMRDPDQHGKRRRLLSSPMAESNLKNLEGFIKEKVDRAIDRIGEEMKKRGAADVLKWWSFLTTDVIGQLSFGQGFDMLEVGKKNQYMLDLEEVGALNALMSTFPTLFKIAYSSYLPIPFIREGTQALFRIRQYSQESIRRYQNIVAADPHNARPTFFTKLMQPGEGHLSEEDIIPEAQTFIVAGTDTTAHTLTYLVWVLSKNVDMKRKLVEEVATLPEGYNDEDLKTLPYLNQIIQETLRVWASVPSALPREVPSGGCEIDGYFMPDGTTVCTQAYSMHRNPEIFPNPESFDPSRWEAPTKEMKDAWMPFGGGARSCIGLNLAKMEIRHATTKFFRTFPNARVSALEGFKDEDMEQVSYFLMEPKGKRCLIQAS